MGKSHHEEMDLPLHAGDVRLGFPKIRLRMAGRVRQWHEHLPPTTAVFANVVLDDGLPALEAMLVTKTLTDPCIAPGSLDTSLSHAAGLSDIAVCHA